MDTPKSLEDVIFHVVRSSTGWMSRSDIANALGRPRRQLYAHDIAQLDKLVMRGSLESRRSGIGVRAAYEYRAVTR